MNTTPESSKSTQRRRRMQEVLDFLDENPDLFSRSNNDKEVNTFDADIHDSTTENPVCQNQQVNRKNLPNESVENSKILQFLQPAMEELNFPSLFKQDITSKECLLMMMANFARHRSTYESLLSNLSVMNIIMVNSNLPKTKKELWKVLGRNDDIITSHIYCCNCCDVIGTDEKITSKCACLKCGPDQDNERTNNFITISLRSQITDFLSKPGVANELKYRSTRRIRIEGEIEDIFDAAEYKELAESGKFLNYEYNYSYIINTDGANVSNSSKTSAWPVFIQLNELHPHSRNKNMFLAAIYVDNQEPHPGSYLLPLMNEMNDLYENGITWKPDGNKTVTSRFIPLIVSMDSGARWKFLRMTQFNGYFGCTFCNQEGEILPGTKHVKYPIEQPGIDRSDKKMRQQARTAVNKKEKVEGIVGPSIFSLLPTFDLRNGFVPDSMHSIYLGAIKHHFEILLNSSGKPWYIGTTSKKEMIDKKILGVIMPNCITRRVRSITEIKQWKASEFRNMIYYMLSCLDGILSQEYLYHLSLLFDAAWILNKNSITGKELKIAETNLEEYTKKFQQYFGKSNMTHNIHLLKHQVKSVRDWGPFWVHSTSSFESVNKKIIDSTITSANSRPCQVYTRFLVRKFIEKCYHDSSIDEEVRNHKGKELNINHDELEENNDTYEIRFKVMKKGHIRSCEKWEYDELRKAGYDCLKIQIHQSALIDGIEYRAKDFRPTTTFCNSIVFSSKYGFLRILNIVEFDSGVNRIQGIFGECSINNGFEFNTHFINKIEFTENKIFIEKNYIDGPAFLINVEKCIHAIALPNVWETD